MVVRELLGQPVVVVPLRILLAGQHCLFAHPSAATVRTQQTTVLIRHCAFSRADRHGSASLILVTVLDLRAVWLRGLS